MKTRNLSALRFAILGGCAALCLSTVPAMAQDNGGSGWTVTAGAGAQIYPKYPGAHDYTVFPLPIFGLRRQGAPMPFISQDDGIGFGLLGQDSVVNFGPAFSVEGRRRESDVGAAVGNVPFTIEAGGFVELTPVRNFRLRAELRQGLGGHRGLVGAVGADVVLRDNDTYIFAVGPRARWGDSDFNRAYFGVTPAIATATGLPAYTATSGFYAVGGVANLTYKLGSNWGMRSYFRYDRLINDAARSPIVRSFGSRDQFSGGAGLFLEFNVGGRR